MRLCSSRVLSVLNTVRLSGRSVKATYRFLFGLFPRVGAGLGAGGSSSEPPWPLDKQACAGWVPEARSAIISRPAAPRGLEVGGAPLLTGAAGEQAGDQPPPWDIVCSRQYSGPPTEYSLLLSWFEQLSETLRCLEIHDSPETHCPEVLLCGIWARIQLLLTFGSNPFPLLRLNF